MLCIDFLYLCLCTGSGELSLLNVVCLEYQCKMGELSSFGRKDDAHSLAVWTGKSAAQCTTLCLAKSDCDAFTYVTKDNRCIAHRKIMSPKKSDCCSYWVKTCPGLQQQGSKYQSVGFCRCPLITRTRISQIHVNVHVNQFYHYILPLVNTSTARVPLTYDSNIATCLTVVRF